MSTATDAEPAHGASPAVVKVPLDKIRPSPFNYRRTHGGLAELANSIREHGIQQPVKLRPVSRDENGAEYELVYGERRFLASREAQRNDIPAIVEDLSDEQVQELQFVENAQRADVHPLEEAEGFERMLRVQGPHGPAYSVSSLAQLVGRSEQHVYGRLQLTALTEAGRVAFYDGRLNASTALLLARVPAALQDQALREIVEPRFHGEPMSTRQASELLQSRYMTQLERAPFPTDDAELVAAAGACTACPKRTGNARLLFADVERDDVCTDPTCFASKIDACWERAVQDARELGRTVLSPRESEKLFPGGRLAYGASYVDLEERCDADPKNRPWRRLLKKVDLPVTIARDGFGRAHELVGREVAFAALRELGIVSAKQDRAGPGSIGGPRSAEAKLAAAKAREEAVLHRAIASAAVDKIVARISKKGASREDLALWLDTVLRGSWSDTIRDVCKRRGLAYDGKTPAPAALAAAADKMTAAELQALAVELGLSRGLYSFYEGAANTFGETFKRACSLHGVELSGLRRAAKAARAAKLQQRAERSGAAATEKATKKGRARAA